MTVTDLTATEGKVAEMEEPPVRESSISVIIPAHDAAGTIDATLESLADSRELLHEVIVVDDSSSDGTGAIAGEAGGRLDLPVQTFRVDRRDAGAARNAGLARASGRYVYFLDADDIALPGGLRALHDAFSGGRASIAVGATLRRTEGLPDKVKTVSGLGPDRATNANTLLMDRTWSIAMGSALVAREVAQAVRFPEGVGLDEDTCYWAAVAAYADFAIVDRTVLLYFLDAQRMEDRYAAAPRHNYLKLSAAYTALARHGLDRETIRWRRAWIALRLTRMLTFRRDYATAADLLRLTTASRHLAGRWVTTRYRVRVGAGLLRQRLFGTRRRG